MRRRMLLKINRFSTKSLVTVNYGETPPIFKSKRKRSPGLYRMLLLFLELHGRICILPRDLCSLATQNQMLFGSCMPSSPKESISPFIMLYV